MMTKQLIRKRENLWQENRRYARLAQVVQFLYAQMLHQYRAELAQL